MYGDPCRDTEIKIIGEAYREGRLPVFSIGDQGCDYMYSVYVSGCELKSHDGITLPEYVNITHVITTPEGIKRHTLKYVPEKLINK